MPNKKRKLGKNGVPWIDDYGDILEAKGIRGSHIHEARVRSFNDFDQAVIIVRMPHTPVLRNPCDADHVYVLPSNEKQFNKWKFWASEIDYEYGVLSMNSAWKRDNWPALMAGFIG
jgi:hypothetical protein